MTSTNRRACGVLAAIAFGLMSTNVLAAPSPADLAAARELYRVGMDAYEAGNVQGAVEKLSAAWSLVQTPLIGVGLAHAYDRGGKLLEAREVTLAIRRLEVVNGESARSKEARTEAENLDTALARKIPHAHINVVNAPANAAVTIDGENVAIASLAVDRSMNPGKHALAIMIGPRVLTTADLSIVEGERKEITLTAPTEAPTVVEPTPIITTPTTTGTTPTPTRIESTPEKPVNINATSNALTVSGAVVGGLGLVTGAIFGSIAIFEANSLAQNCPGKVCQPDSFSTLNLTNTASTTSTIAFVIGGVGAVIFFIGLATHHKKESVHTAHVGWNGLVF